MKKIAFITRGDAEYGFTLAGVNQYVTELENAEKMLREIVSEPDTGLVIIDERLLEGINDEKLRALERTWHGILIVLPAPERARIEIEDYAARLIRRAIGYHVKLSL
ncbi:MAG: V-type ATP synthase subunit F [Thermodesulfovibrionia bacterium]|nr:V-type ATP synthase subunit F [Thermodesulfovibrionia bacterium]